MLVFGPMTVDGLDRPRDAFLCLLRAGKPGICRPLVKQDQDLERIPKSMSDERFPRVQRLRSSQDFVRVRRRGRQVSGSNLILHYARQSPGIGGISDKGSAHRPTGPIVQPGNERGPTRIGFSVSKRVGGAITRNLVKRRLREAARHRLVLLASGWDLIVTARPPSASAQYLELAAELDDLFTRAGMWVA
jgi:ribonuclease P protein component